MEKTYSPDQKYYYTYTPSNNIRNESGYLLDTSYLSVYQSSDILVVTMEHRKDPGKSAWIIKDGVQYLMCPSLKSCSHKYCDAVDPTDPKKWDYSWYKSFVLNCQTGELYDNQMSGPRGREAYYTPNLSILVSKEYDGHVEYVRIYDMSTLFGPIKKWLPMEIISDCDAKLEDIPYFSCKWDRNQRLLKLPVTSEYISLDDHKYSTDFAWFNHMGSDGVIIVYYGHYWKMDGKLYNEHDHNTEILDKGRLRKDEDEFLNVEQDCLCFIKNEQDGKLHLIWREQSPHKSSMLPEELDKYWHKVGMRYRLRDSKIPNDAEMMLEKGYYGIN